jgi:hypothetical protein
VSEDPVSELYGGDLSAFVVTRSRIEKALRKDNRREEADAVKALRKPTVAAWALNQVATAQPELISVLLDTASALRKAMEDAIAGDRSGIRAAEGEHRDALRAVRAAARHALEGSGHTFSDSVDRKVTGTLQAASVDRAVAETLMAGRISTDLQPDGFGIDVNAVSSPSGPAGPKQHEQDGTGPAPDAEAHDPGTTPDHNTDEQAVADEDPVAERQEETRTQELQDEVDRLAGRARRLAVESDRAGRDLVDAQDRADAADRALAEATAAAEEAHRQLADTDRDAQSSRHALSPASRAAVMKAGGRVWGPIGLSIPARLVTRRTMRAAP